MWHVSIAYHPRGLGRGVGPAELDPQYLLRAERALAHVGDAALGEWLQQGVDAWHLRRRVSADEAHRWELSVRDVRGTAEAARRLGPVAHLLPAGWAE